MNNPFHTVKFSSIYLLFFLCTLTLNTFGQAKKTPDWRSMGSNKDVTFYQVRDAFYDYWKDKTPSKGQGYSVFKRWEAQMLPRVYPSGDMTLPSRTYQNYMQWLENSDNKISTRSITSNWSSLGPNQVPSGYDAGVGRIDFVRFDPVNTNIIYVGSPDGGLWKTTDGGLSWNTNTDFLGVIGCSDLAIDPNSTTTMYLATGNWENDKSSIGVLKTVDGGITWNTTSLSWDVSESYEIRELIMDPTNPLVMMVATDGGIFKTSDGWQTNSLTNINGAYNIDDIKFKPFDSDIVYASGKSSANTNIFWRSIDNGDTWSAVSTGLPSSNDVSRVLIGVTENDNNYVYLIAGNANRAYKGLYQSVNSGSSFSTRSTSPNILSTEYDASGTGGQASHDLAIAVSPTDKDNVLIGGINQWQSLDGGVNWNLFTYWLGVDPNHPGEEDPNVTVPYTHADIQEIQYLPGSSTTIFTTADGGIYKTINNGVSYTDISSNLAVSQQNCIAQSSTNEDILISGLQDIGTIKKSNGTWSVIAGGDGESAFIDRTNDANVVISYPNGGHYLSTDGGISNIEMTGIPPGNLFDCQVIQDPISATSMYAAGRANLYKNSDFVNNPHAWITLGSPPEATSGGSIIKIAVAPSNNDVIYVIKSNEVDAPTISKSIDGGVSFTNITGTLPTSVQMTNLTVSNTDPNKVWVIYSGYESNNKVYRSADGGSNWENMSGGLPNIPMNAIVYVNDSPNDELYLGGDIGVYYYDNSFDNLLPGNWIAFNTNLANSKITALNIFYPSNKLRASTYGRGTWESPISATVPIELVSFTGEQKNGQNYLFWSTVSESNLSDYQLQRSRDGVFFENIGKIIPESPNSVELNRYSFIDKNPFTGNNYYRLLITDLDARFNYSNIILLNSKDPSNDISLFPNPASEIIELKGINKTTVDIRIMNSAGVIFSNERLIDSQQVHVRKLPKGTYFIEINTGTDIIIKQFIKE